ncbi:MAG: type II secretion system F family protein [Minisyncoccia bacterium]
MALFSYKAVDSDGKPATGTIDAVTVDVAVSSLQRRGLIVQTIDPVKGGNSIMGKSLTFFERISTKDVVMLSRQVATLFEAQVSALRAFRLLATETTNPALQDRLTTIANDIQAGMPMSRAMAKHPKVFDNFYVSMVRTGEETGKIDDTFNFLADYLDRNYEITAKAKNALIYPAFVIGVFVIVMILMMTLVIPRMADILVETGQKLPVYTRAVLAISNFLVHYFWLVGIGLFVAVIMAGKVLSSPNGKEIFSRIKLSIPYVGTLYQKLFLSRIADNMATMLTSGIQMIRALEMSAAVVGDPSYEKALNAVAREVQTGIHTSDAMEKQKIFPSIVVAMVRVGEETGDMGKILDTMAKFYRREVSTAVDTLVSMIEPLMIVTLALGVGVLLASVLVPIYNISAGL